MRFEMVVFSLFSVLFVISGISEAAPKAKGNPEFEEL